MSRHRLLILTVLALLGWSGLVAGTSAGIMSIVAMERLAPGGALALCEIVQRAP